MILGSEGRGSCTSLATQAIGLSKASRAAQRRSIHAPLR